MQSPAPVDITPRKYQEAIANTAILGNTLVVLPTGLGKTAIALLVAIQRLNAFSQSKVLILAPTRPLVLQHTEFFRKHYPEPSIGLVSLTGEQPPQVRSELFENSRLIFATPEVVRNDVVRRRYVLNEVSLIVFDEAHRCVRNYAYAQVATAYKSQSENPLVLGLTASPSARKSRIQEICDRLSIEKVETRTETDEDVNPYVQDVSVNWEKLTLPSEYRHASAILRKAFDERVQKLITIHQLPANVPIGKRILLELGHRLHRTLRQGRGGAFYGAITLQSQAMSLLHSIDMLETQGARNAFKFLSRLEMGKTRSARGLSKDARVVEATKLLSTLKNVDHPKQERLKQLLSEDIQLNPTAKMIVFTQFRETADMIVDDLKETDNMFPVRFVGQATRNEHDIGLTQAEQAEIIEEFGGPKYNVLVTTSIGEEGLHIPDVDHVIFYEAVPSEIRMIQRRGRTGRTKPGKTTIMITEGTVDEAYYWSSKRKEQQMHRHLETFKKNNISQRPRKESLLDYA